MTEKRFRVNGLVKYNYSEIGEYIDENHTDRPLRNDKIVDLLNTQHEQIQELQQKNEWLIDRISELITEMSELGFSIELEDKERNTIDLTGDF